MAEPKNNEPLSGLTHLLGAMLSVAALVILAALASARGSAWHIVSFSVYGTSLILLYLASAAYHFLPLENSKKTIFRKIDHSLIYILIAGTYTPVCLTVLRGGWGWSIFGVVWGMALAGVFIKLREINISGWLSAAIYVLMGWIALIAIFPILESLSQKGLFWLLAGGAFYTTGTAFFALDKVVPRKRWFGMHEIFHIFVLAGSFCHFWMMFELLS